MHRAGKLNILLVDDRPDKSVAMRSVLETLDENLIVVRSGKEALRQLLANEFALVLMDVHMPVMDGFDTASLIRERPSLEKLPIIFITAATPSELQLARGYSLGAVDFIFAPVSGEIIKAKVSAILELERKARDLEAIVRQRTAALQESRERYHLFVESAKDFAIFFMDTQGTITEWNPGAERILGWSESEILGKHLSIIFTPEDIENRIPEKELSEAAQGKNAGEERWHTRKDGTRIWSSGRVVGLHNHGKLIGFAKIFRDSTQRKKNEQALRESEERFRAFVTASSDVVYRMSADWKEMRQLQGRDFIPDTNGTSRNWLEKYIHPDDQPRVLAAIQEAIQTKSKFEVENRVLRVDGTLGWTLARAIPLLDERGEIVEWIGTASDVTWRKEAEEALHEAQRQLQLYASDLEQKVEERTAKLRETIQELEAFSYSISHDMRGPLRAMEAYSRALLEDFGEQIPDEGKGYVKRIGASAVRLDALISDVLAYSRVLRAPITSAPVDVEKLLEEIIDQYPAFQPPKTEIEIHQPLPKVLGHEASLTQCITNLLGNAVKFVAQGAIPKVKIWGEPRGEEVRLWFVDNGIGIAPRYQQRIFEMFQRVHPEQNYEGTGIGLAIVRKAVERMGGTYGLESEEGKGSRFWIQLKKA